MKINVQNTILGITAGNLTQIPRDNRPQIVFSGRSNVGKSSLINSLLGRKSLARVSSAPGKTITLNFYDIDKAIYFVDIPGYGYAKRAQRDKARWSALTDGFLRSPCEKRLFIQLIDMKVGPTEDDFDMLDWLCAAQAPYIIAATKSDKLNKTEYAYAENELKKLGVTVIPFSALNNSGRDLIWKEIYDFI